MARQQPGQSPADFIREQGWEDTVLYGVPIMRANAQIEHSVTLVVTAVGEREVLARAAGGLHNRREGMWTFDSREWFVNGEQERGSAGIDE